MKIGREAILDSSICCDTDIDELGKYAQGKAGAHSRPQTRPGKDWKDRSGKHDNMIFGSPGKRIKLQRITVLSA